MNKVLLCDANFCVVPLLKSMQKKFNVAVVGINKNDPCHYLAKESYFIDYSSEAELLELFKDNKFDYIVSGCNDQSYLSSAFVAEKLKKPGYDDYQTALIIHHKDKFREYCETKK